MKQLIALCLILCVMLLSACNGLQTPPPIVENAVPESLLECAPQPPKPDFNTGSNKKDFQNATTYTAQVKTAGEDCRSKLGKVKSLIQGVPAN